MTRIRTTHVGSLVRTPELVEIMRAREHGEPVDPATHAEVLTASVADVVRRQVEIGIDVVSDGEYGKSDSWSRYIRERLGGFTSTEAGPAAAGRSNVPPGTDKHLFGEFYAEYEATQGFVGGGGEWRATEPIHYTGAAAIGRDIVDLVLRVPVGTYSLEQANPRHEHEWRVWEDVTLPEGKVLMPGMVSHATNVVEHPELVADRIVRLAKLVGPERVIASSDCGFAQGPLVRRVHPSIQWAKLDALVRGARLAEQRLRGPVSSSSEQPAGPTRTGPARRWPSAR